MTAIHIVLDGDGKFPQLADAKIHQPDASELIVTSLARGTESGRTSVAFIAQLDDGSYVFLENTMANFIKVAVAFHARYPEEWESEGVSLICLPAPRAPRG